MDESAIDTANDHASEGFAADTANDDADDGFDVGTANDDSDDGFDVDTANDDSDNGFDGFDGGATFFENVPSLFESDVTIATCDDNHVCILSDRRLFMLDTGQTARRRFAHQSQMH